MASPYDVLQERGLVADVTDAAAVRKLLAKPPVTFYVGFDPTADSLHVGHLLPIVAMAHLQRGGHRPIAVVGGGTGMVGDPSGKTELRSLLTLEEIGRNLDAQKRQLRQFLVFADDSPDGLKPTRASEIPQTAKAKMVNNADWLAPLNYIEFLRDVGVHFTVNRMLAAECFKQRWEKGLTFIEFNYMLLQAYDFLELYRREGCRLQVGGSDQWGNICAGVDLVRRVEGADVYGLTVPLLLASGGKKFGKTEKGAVWLSAERTTPYEFYQYWRNVDDKDVERCLRMLTFLPMDEVRKLANVEAGPALNEAKKRLAEEVTELVHGHAQAVLARATSLALFEKTSGVEAFFPTPADMKSNYMEVSEQELAQGISIIDALVGTKLAKSKSEARRLIEQGGVYVNEVRIESIDGMLTPGDARNGQVTIRAGKKKYGLVVIT